MILTDGEEGAARDALYGSEDGVEHLPGGTQSIQK